MTTHAAFGIAVTLVCSTATSDGGARCYGDLQSILRHRARAQKSIESARNRLPDYAVWEIHPAMKLTVQRIVLRNLRDRTP